MTKPRDAGESGNTNPAVYPQIPVPTKRFHVFRFYDFSAGPATVSPPSLATVIVRGKSVVVDNAFKVWDEFTADEMESWFFAGPPATGMPSTLRMLLDEYHGGRFPGSLPSDATAPIFRGRDQGGPASQWEAVTSVTDTTFYRPLSEYNEIKESQPGSTGIQNQFLLSFDALASAAPSVHWYRKVGSNLVTPFMRVDSTGAPGPFDPDPGDYIEFEKVSVQVNNTWQVRKVALIR